jgi:hypothetical protein
MISAHQEASFCFRKESKHMNKTFAEHIHPTEIGQMIDLPIIAEQRSHSGMFSQ